ncbi:hypothetical protein KFK09_008742 [Dendrobium nobile]|uniref:Reverse transcriptase domain-containing protein n=1 Tax=Dendrobium nobile TaxID=94219 RepID=A0A8T3BQR8_DENNO|nr:hypothetical protein KFK09_008742 [Dendrobium nobile]
MQWSKFNGFHLTSTGMNWILYSFKSDRAVEEILNGGPWYVSGYIVGMDRWSPAFDLYSFKGIFAPVWIRFSCMPLYCWDEDNLARVASRFGSPMYLDGNTFRWGKREFVHVCVKIYLEKKLPNGVWINGLARRFFQQVEYEEINLLYYQCGQAGHDENECLEGVVQGIKDQMMPKPKAGTGEGKRVEAEAKPSVIKSEYGPWIHVQFKNRIFTKGIAPGRGRNADNGVRSISRGNINQKIIMQKQILKEKEPTAAVDNSVSASKNWSDKEKVVEDRLPEEKGWKAEFHVWGGIPCTNIMSSLLFWNCRGAKKKEAALYLKGVVRDQDIFFIGLMETKMASIDRKDVDGLIGNDWEYFHFPAVGLSGGILVLWNKMVVSFVVKETSSQMIVGDLSVPNLGIWKVVTVYGSRCCKERESLWSQLGMCMEDSIPSIIGGDFNCILNKEEKRAGKRFLFSKGPRDMKCFMTNFDFHDVDQAIIRHLARVASDHSPIVFKLDERVRLKLKTIKFEDTWRSYPASKSIVYHSWKKNDFGDEEEVAALNTEFSVNELQQSVFQQGSNRSPVSGRMRMDWKDTLIVLIAKLKTPLIPSNYRPISLCQTNYKISAKMLVNILKNCIPKKIIEEQMAFILGRSISEHCLLAQEIFHKFKISKNKKGLMALKLDMEQAYDSMGWPTLGQIIKWYGFPSMFSNLLMECVVDVRFSIIINGKNSKWINAHSGFRQGCQLSPYLYIMCSQLLSNSLEQRGQSIGIQLSSRGPKITHLLYADDVLIFSHVFIALAKALKVIVEDFCKWTGQRINVNKSQIIFSQVVRYPMKKRIAKVFGFKVVKEMSYLGIKISLDRLKMADFQELFSKVMDRLNAWGKKSLSMGEVSFGINLMVVVVCIMLLGEICVNREKLETLFHRTIKAKYGNNVMNVTHKKVTSKAWKILLYGGRHLKSITRWKVGIGDEINVLNDVWILDKCINRGPTFVDCDSLEGVDFSMEDRVELQSLYFGKTVSALSYEHLLKYRFNIDDDGYCNWLNKLKLNKKVEMFWWRLGKSTIPINLFLRNRRISVTDTCAKGCQAVESYEHIMVHCKYLVEFIMQMLEWGIHITVSQSLEYCLKELRRLTVRNPGIVKIYCTIVYFSWKNRNDVKHGKVALPCSLVAANALSLAITKSSPYLSNWGTNLLKESQNTWFPPPKD